MASSMAALRRRQPIFVCWSCRLGGALSQRRTITQNFIRKTEEAKQAWDQQAKEILEGKRQNLYDVLEERGFIKDVAPSRDVVRELMRIRRIGAYVGVDPTASSLHVGHLLPLMPLFWMYMHGYSAFSLLGGSTVKIGDPTGRVQDRKPIASADLAMNMTKMHFQMKQLWMNVEAEARRWGYKKEWAWKRGIINNNTWWNSQPMLEVLRRVGSHMRVAEMLKRDTVKKKMKEGNGVSLAEFCYPILQGWDWWMLRTRLGVQMQIGGSDQWGNIVTGMDVFKAARESEPDPAKRLPAESVYDDPVGFTVPLLTDSAGNKFGKSAGNAIWLDKFQTSTFDLYGFFVRRPDDEIEKLLKLFTFIPTPQIQQIMTEQAEDPGKRVAHHRLAYEVARLVHGEEEAERAQQQHKLMYGKGAAIMPPTPEAPAEGASSVLQTLVQSTGKPKGPTPITPNNAPRPDLKLPRSLIMTGSISKILYAAGLAESRKEGHRLALQQAAYIGGIPKGGPGAPMDPGMLTWLPVKLWAPEDTRRYLIDDKILLLRRGKHNIRIIEVISDEEYGRLGLTYPGQPGTGRIRRLREQMKLLKEGKTTAEAVKKFMKEQLGMEKELAAFGAEAPEEESDDVFRLPERKSPHQLRLEMQLNEMVEKMEKEEEAAKKANRDEE